MIIINNQKQWRIEGVLLICMDVNWNEILNQDPVQVLIDLFKFIDRYITNKGLVDESSN